jgi:glycosyltransferase involved in cell wall biosynthesis
MSRRVLRRPVQVASDCRGGRRSGPRVAIVADYLNQRGGAEWVVAILHTMFPEAPVFTPILDRASLWPQLIDADIRVSWMQRLPGLQRHFRKYFALYPLAVEGFDLSSYDLVLSSSCAFGKGARVAPHAVHVCYCHTPMRFVWDYEAYIAREGLGIGARSLLPPLIRLMRWWDVRTSARPHAFVANSTTVADRIRRYYGREASVIPPPVDVSRFAVGSRTEPYYLVVSRLQAYKRIDLAVQAFTRLGLPLRIVGDGPDRAALEHLAGPNVEFLGRVSDREVARMMAECQALVTPGLEDFGIAAVEANASGRPVLAFRGGGALDIVLERLNGLTFAEPSADALVAAVEQHRRLRWDPRAIREYAERFDVGVFRRRLLEFIGDVAGVPLDVSVAGRGAS